MGFDLGLISDNYARARRGAYGRHGHADGMFGVSPSVIVCTSEDSAIPLFVPREAPASDVVSIDTDLRKLLIAARAARNPKELEHLRARTTLTPKMVQRMAALEAKSAKVASAQDRVAEVLSTPGAVIPTNRAKTTWMSGGAMAVQFSGNEKISGVRNTMTTYASIEHTCPTSCAQRGKACYAETSNNIRPIVMMLTHVANVLGHTPEMVAEDEARAIDASFALGVDVPTDLRIHTVGDARSRESVQILASAASRWLGRTTWRGNFAFRNDLEPRVWTYTHAWYEHSRADWGPVSTLASIQTVPQLSKSRRDGWAPTIVVPPSYFSTARNKDGSRRKFFDDSGYPIPFTIGDLDTQFIPCPAQNPDESKAVGCVNCRICFDDRTLFRKNQGVAFEAHASGKIRGVPFRHAELVVANANSKKRRHLSVVG